MYVKNTDDWTKIPANLKQVFQIKFSNNVPKGEIIKMKNEGIITDRDLEIVKFLFKFKFATLNQIRTYLNNSISEIGLRTRLEKLIQYRVLNKFMLSDDSEEATHILSDSLLIFCLDIGGKYLLTNYSSLDTAEWSYIVNMKSSENISEDLNTLNFYLRIINTCPNKLVFFNTNPELRNGRKVIIPSFEFCLNIENSKKYFVGKIVKNCDLANEFRQTAIKLENILNTNAWKKYYSSDSPPNLFIVAEDDLGARDCGRILYESTMIKKIAITTNKRLENTLYEKGTFLSYSQMTDKLKPVKASMFK